MASAIRDFSYLFIYSKKLEEYSTLARIVFTSTLVTASILAARNNSILSMLLGLVYVVSIVPLCNSEFQRVEGVTECYIPSWLLLDDWIVNLYH